MVYIKLLKLKIDSVGEILTTCFEDIITTKIDICPKINRLGAKEAVEGIRATSLVRGVATTARKVVGVLDTTTMTLLEAS